MFKSSDASSFVASKSVSVKPEVVSDVKSLDQIRLLIPSFVQFYDPTQSYLRFQLKMEDARGVVIPDAKAGAHALFRNVIIRDGSNSATIHNLEDYNVAVSMTRPFTEQSSIKHKRELFEGVQQDANNSGASLYYGAPQSLAGTSVNSPQTAEREAKTIEVYLQLQAGIMADKVVPNMALQGTRIQIDTEDILRCLHQPFLDGSLEGGLSLCPRFEADQVAGEIGTRDGATTASNIGDFTTDIVTSDAGEGNPFAIGDKIYASADDGTGEVLLGVARGFFNNAAKLGISLTLQADTGTQVPAAGLTAATTRIYYKLADREQSLSTISETNLTNVADKTTPSVSYTISDLEFLAMSVTPPPAYVSGLTKSVTGGSGIAMDYMDVELHRHNQSNSQGLVQVQVPTITDRAKSIFSVPIADSSYRTLQTSSFSGIPDGARNYQWVIGTELIPSRAAPLARYSQAVGTTTEKKSESLHCSELEKAISNIGMPVRSLQKIADSFVIPRALNKMGQVTTLSDDSVALRVEYPAGSVQKTFNTFIYKLSRVMVKGGVVSVM